MELETEANRNGDTSGKASSLEPIHFVEDNVDARASRDQSITYIHGARFWIISAAWAFFPLRVLESLT